MMILCLLYCTERHFALRLIGMSQSTNIWVIFINKKIQQLSDAATKMLVASRRVVAQRNINMFGGEAASSRAKCFSAVVLCVCVRWLDGWGGTADGGTWGAVGFVRVCVTLRRKCGWMFTSREVAVQLQCVFIKHINSRANGFYDFCINKLLRLVSRKLKFTQYWTPHTFIAPSSSGIHSWSAAHCQTPPPDMTHPVAKTYKHTQIVGRHSQYSDYCLGGGAGMSNSIKAKSITHSLIYN